MDILHRWPQLDLHPPSVFGCFSPREIYLDSAAAATAPPSFWHARLFGRSTEFLPLEIITEGQIRRYASGRQIIISSSSTNDLRLPTSQLTNEAASERGGLATTALPPPSLSNQRSSCGAATLANAAMYSITERTS